MSVTTVRGLRTYGPHIWTTSLLQAKILFRLKALVQSKLRLIAHVLRTGKDKLSYGIRLLSLTSTRVSCRSVNSSIRTSTGIQPIYGLRTKEIHSVLHP